MSIIPPAAVLTKRERQRQALLTETPAKPKEEPLQWQDYNDALQIFSWCEECGILAEHGRIHLCGIDTSRSHQERNALIRNSLNGLEILALKELRSYNDLSEANDEYQCCVADYPVMPIPSIDKSLISDTEPSWSIALLPPRVAMDYRNTINAI